MSRKARRGPAVAALSKRREALLVLDVDEVVLQFIAPFQEILAEHGAHLNAVSFKLTGNVRSLSTGAALTGRELDRVTELLYAEQGARQRPVPGVVESLGVLRERFDIVFLTAMTPAFYDQRRQLLDDLGLDDPMIATEHSKGGVVAELAERWTGPIVFVDDLPPNLETVGRSVERAHLVHLMANDVFREHLPPLPRRARPAADWPALRAIAAAIADGDG